MLRLSTHLHTACGYETLSVKNMTVCILHKQYCAGLKGMLTKFLLAPVPMEVDPQLAADVVFHARIFLVMEAVEGTAHHRVDLKKDKMYDCK